MRLGQAVPSWEEKTGLFSFDSSLVHVSLIITQILTIGLWLVSPENEKD